MRARHGRGVHAARLAPVAPVAAVALLAPVAILALSGCGASPPPLEAHERAVGVEGAKAEIRLGAWRCEVPADLLANVEVRFEREGAVTRVALEPAPLGATLEGLADAEAETLALLEPDHALERALDAVGGLRAIRFDVGPRRVWIAMQNPWRVLRVRAERATSEGLLPLQVGSLSMDVDGALREATFQGPGGRGRVRAGGDELVVEGAVRCSGGDRR